MGHANRINQHEFLLVQCFWCVQSAMGSDVRHGTGSTNDAPVDIVMLHALPTYTCIYTRLITPHFFLAF